MYKSKFLFLIICLFMIIFSGCKNNLPDDNGDNGDNENENKEQIIDFDVSETNINLEVGEKKVLKVTKKGNIDFSLFYESSNDEIVKMVNEEITALSNGSATITIKGQNGSNEKIKTVNVTVTTPKISLSGQNKMFTLGSQTLSLDLSSKLTQTINWLSSDTSIATVDDKGNVTALKAGTVTISATAIASKVTASFEITIEDKIINPEEIVISVSEETIYLDSEVKLIAKVLPEGASQNVIWSCPNASRAQINENGEITILKSGKITFRCESLVNSNIKANITLEVLDYIDPVKFFNSIHIANPLNNVVTATGYGPIYAAMGLNQIKYNQVLAGSVSLITWNEPLYVNENYLVPKGNNPRPGTIRKVHYITVHDTGTTHSTATAQNLANNLKSTSNQTGWHYSCGSGIVFNSIPDNEVAYHAGDGTKVPLEFTDSKIKATSNESAKITISDDGYWMFNGIKSELKAPLVPIQVWEGNERVTIGERIAKNSDLPYTGINNFVGENGNYWMGNVWWSESYQTLSNRGGNLNSIGIESCVNYGTDLYRVWMTLAQLISTRLLPRNYLTPADVKQHNTFSGKNCPQTMREADLWPHFMERVNAEYTFHTKLRNDFTITFTSNNLDLVSKTGQIIKFPEVATEVTYTIDIVKNDGTYNKTLTYKSVIPAKITNVSLIGNEDPYYYMIPEVRAKQIVE